MLNFMEVASGRSNFSTGFSGEIKGWIDIADHCWLVRKVLGSSPGLPAAFSLSEMAFSFPEGNQ